jgi:tetratricopeptide (TPR) repeat protein
MSTADHIAALNTIGWDNAEKLHKEKIAFKDGMYGNDETAFYESLEEYKDLADFCFWRVIELDMGNAEAYAGLAYNVLSYGELTVNIWEYCNIAIGLDQNCARAWAIRAYVNSALGKEQDAAADRAKALELSPNAGILINDGGLPAVKIRSGEMGRT